MVASVLDPVFSFTVVVTMLPGLALGLALGLRSWLLIAAAPLLSFGIIGIAASALALLGLRWSPLAFAVTTVVLSVCVVAIRVVIARRSRPTETAVAPTVRWGRVHHAGTALAVLVATVVGIGVTVVATHGFTTVPQIWDAVFHSNAIRYIADTGFSDPAQLRNLNNTMTSDYYYPNAFHVAMATVVMATGSAVPAVIDMSVVLFPAFLAIGIVALVRACGGRPALAAAGALLACAFTAFPYDLLPWGTLLPFIMSVALVPAFLALLATMLDRPTGRAAMLPVALGIGGIGLLALHPSGAVAAALFAIALLGQTYVRRRPRWSDARTLGATVATATVLGAPLLRASFVAASGPGFDWPATLQPADAMGQVLFLSHDQPFPQYWLVALMIVGLFRRRTLEPLLWFVIVGVLFVGLFVLAASYSGTLVAVLTRPWWNDSWRFAGMWTLAAVILAATGTTGVVDGVMVVLRRMLPPLRRASERLRVTASAAVLAAVAVLVALLTNGFYVGRNEVRLAQAFTDGPAVSIDERIAFDRLAQLVEPGGLAMNDPYDGSAMMWALDNVQPVFASPVITPQEVPTMDPDRWLLFNLFNRLDTDVAVQRTVRDLGLQYVIIDNGFIAPARDHAPGLRDLEDVKSLQLVYDNPDARIYAIHLNRASEDSGDVTTGPAGRVS